MRISIMQPYFLPYLGYFQLINYSDKHIVYDDVNYIKGGWINRNRILANGKPAYITIPLNGTSSFKKINEISIDMKSSWQLKMKKTIEQNYCRAPQFVAVLPILERILFYKSEKLADYVLNSLKCILDYLGIKTRLVDSSSEYNNCSLHSQERILDICRKEQASEYVNAIGGLELYNRNDFEQFGIKLLFMRNLPIEYPQNKNPFIPSLSIVDVMMFNDVETIRSMLDKFDLVSN